jgi:hypothetical protein
VVLRKHKSAIEFARCLWVSEQAHTLGSDMRFQALRIHGEDETPKQLEVLFGCGLSNE